MNMASSSKPTILDRMAMANAKAQAAVLACAKREMEEVELEETQEAATSFDSPAALVGGEPSKRTRKNPSPADDSGAGVIPGASLVPVLAASGPSSSSSADGFIFKPGDDLVDNIMDGRLLQGRPAAILSLVELLGAANWPPQDPPNKHACVCFLMQLRGVGTVDWSAADKKYVVSGFTASTLNLATPWAAPPVSVETPSGSESDKPGDAGTEDAVPDDLKGNGGASSSVPALS